MEHMIGKQCKLRLDYYYGLGLSPGFISTIVVSIFTRLGTVCFISTFVVCISTYLGNVRVYQYLLCLHNHMLLVA